MRTYIPDDSTYYALDHGPSTLALVLVGAAIVAAGWVLLRLFVEQLTASVAASNLLDDVEAAAIAASVEMNAVTDGMRAGQAARRRTYESPYDTNYIGIGYLKLKDDGSGR